MRTMRAVLTAMVLVAALAFAGRAGAASAGPVSWAAPVLAEHALADVATPMSGVACSPSGQCIAAGAGGTVVALDPDGGAPLLAPTAAGGADLTQVGCGALCVVGTATTLETQQLHAHSAVLDFAPTLSAPSGSTFAGLACDGEACLAWTDAATLYVSENERTWTAWAPPAGVAGLPIAGAACDGLGRCFVSLGAPGASTSRLASFTLGPDGVTDAAPATTTAVAPLVQISCINTAACVGISATGAVAVTRDPQDATPVWSSTQVVPAGSATSLVGVDCPTETLCVVPLSDGRVASITGSTVTLSGVLDPSGLGDGGTVVDMTCPRVTTCLVPDGATPGLVTLTFGATALSGATLSPGLGLPAITGLACPASRLCLGVDAGGALLRTTTPGGPAGGWQRFLQSALAVRAGPGADGGFASIACPSIHLCVAGGNDDVLALSTRPATARRWQTRTLGFSFRGSDDGEDPVDFTHLACPSVHLCLAVGLADPADGYPDQAALFASTRPAGPASSWRALHVGALGGVACASTRLCVAGSTDRGRVTVSTRPVGRHARWSRVRVGSSPVTAVACPSSHLCLAGDASGILHVSRRPAAGPGAWRSVRLATVPLVAVDCASARRCVALAADGTAEATTRPAGPPGGWRPTMLDRDPYGAATPIAQTPTALACVRGMRRCLAGTAGGVVVPGTF